MDDKPNVSEPPVKPRRRWYQYSLRTLLIFVTLAGCGFARLGVKMREARDQAAAVALVEKAGGFVMYDTQEISKQVGLQIVPPQPPGPAWLRALVGDEFFRNVIVLSYTSDVAPLGTRNELGDADVEHFKNLTRLVILDLDRTQVTDSGLAHLKGLARLEMLGISNSKVTDAGLEQLKGLSQLEDLDLAGTRVTDAGLESLKGLTQLKRLDLSGTKVTRAGATSFRRALPNCQIFVDESWVP